MRVLVTGGAGFIGAHLARRLAHEGSQVDIVDDFSRGERDADFLSLVAHPGVRALDVDLLATGSLEGHGEDYHRIFHLAAVVGVANVVRRPFEVLSRNVGLLLPVLELARRQRRLSRLVFASTSEVYAGTNQRVVPTPESVPLHLPDLATPRTSYLLSKVYGEALCCHAGVPVTVVRPHNVYGPRMGMAHVIPELLDRAAAGDGTLTVRSPTHRRAFCFVDDAVDQILQLSMRPAAEGGTFNVGNAGEEVAMAELAARTAALVDPTLEIRFGEDTPGSPPRRCPDMTRTRAVTGQVPRVDLQEGLALTWAWYRTRVAARAGRARSPEPCRGARDARPE